MSRAIAIIPARSGSKRIPGKNIRPFLGKPIIAYSIELALSSGLFDEVVVSTDSESIAEVARIYGAKVPFLRDANLADDKTPLIPTIAHALQQSEQYFGSFNYCCCILPTAPLLTVDILSTAYELLTKSESGYVFPACKCGISIFRTFSLDENGKPDMFWPENRLKSAADFPIPYYDAGQFYWGHREAFVSCTPVFVHPHSRAVHLPGSAVVDIDTEDDWARAEQIALGKAPKGKSN